MTDLRENVALAIRGVLIRPQRFNFSTYHGYGGYQALADAALSIARPAIIEECAKVAEAYPDLWEEPNHGAKAIRKLASEEIAAGIRTLAEKPDGFVLVPIEPTEEMLAMAFKLDAEWYPLKNRVGRIQLIKAYRAMISATQSEP